jgi:hypothetical protein
MYTTMVKEREPINPARLGPLSLSSSVSRPVRWLIGPKSDRFTDRLTKLFKMILNSLVGYLTTLIVQALPQGSN